MMNHVQMTTRMKAVFPCALGIKALASCNTLLSGIALMWVPLLPHIPEVPPSILLLLTDGVPFDARGLFGKKLPRTESKL